LHTGFWWGSLRKRDHLEDLGIDEENIKIWYLDWTDLAQERTKRRSLVNTVMKLREHMRGSS